MPTCSFCQQVNPPGTLICIRCHNPLPTPGSRRAWKRIALIVLAVVVILAGSGSFVIFVLPKLHGTDNGIGIFKGSNGENIGISDGQYAFDTFPDRLDRKIKLAATQQYKQNTQDPADAMATMNDAIKDDSSDAEADIYYEDWRIQNLHEKYITIVWGTLFSTSNPGSSREDLQGAYITQQTFNDGSKLNGGLQVRILVANAGGNSADAAKVAQKIVDLKNSDSTFVGVVGWSYSSYTLAAAGILQQAHIPLVSPTASSDLLTNSKDTYFFRVCPTNNQQAIVGADYAFHTLGARKVALLSDPKDPYSNSLASDFQSEFQKDGGTILITRHYTALQPSTISAPLKDALKLNPDMIYFAGYASDNSTVLTDLPPGNMPVMGGDAFYSLTQYQPGSRADFTRLQFTSFAYPDEWDVLNLSDHKPAFFALYAQKYDPHQLHLQDPYGYDRADYGVILSYDATLTLLYACELELKKTTTLTPENVRNAIASIHGSNALQGVSGVIAFNPEGGDPINKVVVVLNVDTSGKIHMITALPSDTLYSPDAQNP